MPRSTADELLDAMQVCDAGDPSAIDDLFERLIARCDPDEIRAALSGRVGRLGGPFGEVVLRVIEAFGTPELLSELGAAVDDQPELPPERAWEALSLLDGAGLVEGHPDRMARLSELEEWLGDAETCQELLAEQLESEPEGIWLALETLETMRSFDRAAILRDLARHQPGPGVAQLLRLSAHAADAGTRLAALEALRELPPPLRSIACARLVQEHPDPEVVAIAGRELEVLASSLEPVPALPEPRLVRSLVTSLDSRGTGWIALSAVDGDDMVTAAFECDVLAGIRDAVGQIGPEGGAALLAELGRDANRDSIEQAPELALGLLSGAWLLSSRDTTPSQRYWLERTAGPGFRPRPFLEPPAIEEGSGASDETSAEAARRVFDACPWWVDQSALTIDLAEERLLSGSPGPLDITSDPGVHRFLFERRIKGRLELDRRMLLWMASFWQAAGQAQRAGSARRLALELMDPQHLVPGHPFIQELTTRSLQAAQDELRRGVDPRQLLA